MYRALINDMVFTIVFGPYITPQDTIHAMPNQIPSEMNLKYLEILLQYVEFDNLKLSPIALKQRLHAVWTLTLPLEKILFLMVKIK